MKDMNTVFLAPAFAAGLMHQLAVALILSDKKRKNRYFHRIWRFQHRQQVPWAGKGKNRFPRHRDFDRS